MNWKRYEDGIKNAPGQPPIAAIDKGAIRLNAAALREWETIGKEFAACEYSDELNVIRLIPCEESTPGARKVAKMRGGGAMYGGRAAIRFFKLTHLIGRKFYTHTKGSALFIDLNDEKVLK